MKDVWLTAYGFEILQALETRLVVDSHDYRKIKKAFAKLDFNLRESEVAVPGVEMSDDLKEAIWWIAENRGKPWRMIKESKE